MQLYVSAYCIKHAFAQHSPHDMAEISITYFSIKISMSKISHFYFYWRPIQATSSENLLIWNKIVFLGAYIIFLIFGQNIDYG